MPKILKFDDEARRALEAGVNKLADAVKQAGGDVVHVPRHRAGAVEGGPEEFRSDAVICADEVRRRRPGRRDERKFVGIVDARGILEPVREDAQAIALGAGRAADETGRQDMVLGAAERLRGDLRSLEPGRIDVGRREVDRPRREEEQVGLRGGVGSGEVVDSQNEAPVVLASHSPVDEKGARVAQMERAAASSVMMSRPPFASCARRVWLSGMAARSVASAAPSPSSRAASPAE